MHMLANLLQEWQGPTTASTHPNLLGCAVFVFRSIDHWKFWNNLSTKEKVTLEERFMGLAAQLAMQPMHRIADYGDAALRALRARMYLPLIRIPQGPELGSVDEGLWGWSKNGEQFLAIGCIEHVLWGQMYGSIPELDQIQKLMNTCDEATIPWAYREGYGFLNSRPALCGNGILYRAWLNLPALSTTQKLDFAIRAIRTQGHDAFSLSAHAARGGWIVVEGKANFGLSVEEQWQDWQNLIKTLLGWEKETLELGFLQQKVEWLDKIHRSHALLSSVYLLDSDEAYQIGLWVRLGISLGLIPADVAEKLNLCFTRSDPAYWQGSQSDPTHVQAELRATFFRENFVPARSAEI